MRSTPSGEVASGEVASGEVASGEVAFGLFRVAAHSATQYVRSDDDLACSKNETLQPVSINVRQGRSDFARVAMAVGKALAIVRGAEVSNCSLWLVSSWHSYLSGILLMHAVTDVRCAEVSSVGFCVADEF